MKLDEPDSKPRRAVSSVDVSMLGAATGERAIVPIAASAAWVFCGSSAILSGPDRIDVPAEAIIALAHTTRPSYLLACSWISPLAGPICSAILTISAQVFGACLTRSLRYQSSCVLDQIGTA